MKTFSGLLLLLIVAYANFQTAHPQNQSGFISLDCGLVPKDTRYVERTTNITYISDEGFINGGVVRRVSEKLNLTRHQQQTWSLRSFPDGQTNCYNLNLTRNQKYLIRGTFLYGNYDGLNVLPSFDLYIGSNKWTSVSIEDVARSSIHEIIHVLPQDSLQVCLVKTGETTPFISSLEIRPLNNSAYVSLGGSLMMVYRVYFPPPSPSVRYVRYDEDIHDRIWQPIFDDDMASLSTDLPVDTSNSYNIPQLVAQSAIVPANSSHTSMNLHWTLDEITAKSHIYMHFAEVQNLGANEIREFNITYNGGKPWFSFFRPSKLRANTIYSLNGVSSLDGHFNFTLTMTANSTLPPLINAIEIYKVLDF